MAPPTVYAQDLASALDASLPAATVLRMAKAFSTQGNWSAPDPVDARGQCLLSYWITRLAHHSGSTQNLTEADLPLLLGNRSLRAVLEASPFRRPLGHAVLESLSEGHYAGPEAFLWSDAVIQALPASHFQDLARGVISTRGPRDPLAMCMAHGRPDAARSFMKRGFGWTPPGRSPATSIASAPAWEFFLETGGDPTQEVISNHGDSPVRMPLWEYLLKHASGHSRDPGEVNRLQESIEQWAKAHAGHALERKELEDYWRRLGGRSTQQDVLSAIRSRKDWHQLRNPMGQNALMVGMGRVMGTIDALAQVAKARPLFEQVDNRGWGFWHHLLDVGAQATSAHWALASKHATARQTPDAPGLLVSLYRHKGLGQQSLAQNQHLEKLAGRLAPEDWWAGSPEDQEGLANHLMGAKTPSGAGFYAGNEQRPPAKGWDASLCARRLSALVQAFPPPSASSPQLLGALAFNELVVCLTKGDTRYRVCDELIEQGASLRLAPDLAERAWGILGFLPQECHARLRRLQLDASLVASPVASPPIPRPRF